MLADLRASGEPWLEFLRVASLRAGLYVLPPGGWDHQTPHEEDELYVVTAGRAVFESADRRQPVASGSIIFVPARQAHRFADIEDEWRALVVFSAAG